MNKEILIIYLEKIKSKPVKNEKNKRKRPVTISGPLPDRYKN